jgi:hypothetical protein
MAKQRWRCTTKPRGSCPEECERIFEGSENTKQAAKDAAEQACQDAGCHTPGGDPHSCNCGHTTCRMLPN